jgi:hypothetical protein
LSSFAARHQVEHVVLLILILVNAGLGLTPFNHYGESTDERSSFEYAAAALQAYSARYPWDAVGVLKYYGPAYLMFADLGSRLLLRWFPSWTLVDARHFINHLIFQVAVVSLYLLCLRFTTARASLIVAFLFSTQPMLFGHSFVNPKDVPFMALFLTAVTLGLWTWKQEGRRSRSARYTVSGAVVRWKAFASSLSAGWTGADRRKRKRTIVVALVTLAVLAELLVVKGLLLPSVESTVARAYDGTSFAPINQWFSRVAAHADQLPVEAYLDKTRRLYQMVQLPAAVLLSIPALLALRATFPEAARSLRPLRWLADLGLSDRRLAQGIVLGGISLGLATSIRTVGFFAGVLVSMVAVMRARERSIVPLVLYWGAACMACYATWPYLWEAPFERFLESARILMSFPYSGDVLYMGMVMDSPPMPWHYVPYSILAQSTVPMVILAVTGLAIGLRLAFSGKLPWDLLSVLLVWFVLPTASVGILGAIVYDGSRQFLFVFPPLLLLGGIAVEAILARLRLWALRVAFVVLIFAPGLTAIMTLHPYEHAYYSVIVGGVRGAYRSYELDPWCTSYREAMEILNSMAPSGARIAVAPPMHLAAPFARPDLDLLELRWEADNETFGADFAMSCTRANLDLEFFPEYPIAWEVKADGGVLTVLRDLRGSR